MATAMPCPRCSSTESDVIDSRPSMVLGHASVRRRRVCQKCGHRYSTFELFSMDIAKLNDIAKLRSQLETAAERVQHILNGGT
jgi:transcriptional regulator NrdR family protein